MNCELLIMNIPRIGFGFDVHAFAPDRELWLGGIRIEHSVGLFGHSDADVLIHALCDALLGAANLRDIGYNFPDTSGEFKNIDSKILLMDTMLLVREKGYEFGNADCTICAEEPKLNPYIPAMQKCLSEVLGVDLESISIKATTTEKLGFTGRKEGMSAYAIILIFKP
jgi:2-C-methyl-D-erythritol 2,4-cyclodiphosphate synthase